ncbi:unnamed protein product, partial [Mesorhabditis spiculigera]
MQEYFSQYIEEYYEVDDVVEEPFVPKLEERTRLVNIEDVISLLEKEKAKDVKVIDLTSVMASPFDYMTICSPINPRHGKALTERIRQSLKLNDDGDSVNRQRVLHSTNSGWFCVEVNKIQIHVMSTEARARYDLESLWEVNENEDQAEASWVDDVNVLPQNK